GHEHIRPNNRDSHGNRRCRVLAAVAVRNAFSVLNEGLSSKSPDREAMAFPSRKAQRIVATGLSFRYGRSELVKRFGIPAQHQARKFAGALAIYLTIPQH